MVITRSANKSRLRKGKSPSFVPITNSFSVVVHNAPSSGKSEYDAGHYGLGNADISWNFERECNAWHTFESESHTVFIDGHFYLSTTSTMRQEENLRKFQQHLLASSLEAALGQIAGGVFAIIVVDKRSQTLYASVDGYGSMPLFYARDMYGIYLTDNQFNFQDGKLASAFEPELDQTAVVEFLKYGYTPFSDSLFEKVQRLRPGQVLSISLKDAAMAVSDERPFFYAAPSERLNNLTDAYEELDDVLERYFERFEETSYFVGLSGGYDSRLATAAVHKFGPELLNFGHAKSNETAVARQIAETYRLSFTNESFPTDLIFLHAAGTAKHFKIASTLEYVHVMHLQSCVRDTGAEFYMDGYMGDVILGGGYFFKKEKQAGRLLRYLINLEAFEQPLSGRDTYSNYLYNEIESIGDEFLGSLTKGSTQNTMRARIARIIQLNEPCVYYHHDFLETLKHYTRGMSLIAAGPVAISAYAKCGCIYMDYDVRDVCFSIAKNLRANNAIYNHYLSKRFPEMARIRKAGTYGKPTDPNLLFRAKDIAFGLAKKTIHPLRDKLTKEARKEESYFTLDGYLSQPDNAAFIQKSMDNLNSLLPSRVANFVVQEREAQTLNKRLFMRFFTINEMLNYK